MINFTYEKQITLNGVKCYLSKNTSISCIVATIICINANIIFLLIVRYIST